MIIETPSEITNVLYKGELEYNTTAQQRSYDRHSDSNTVVNPRPVVATIGEPQWWDIAKLYPADKVPEEMKQQLGRADFFLVQLACSLRPEPDQHVEWARFSVSLSPKRVGVSDPIAIDLHPMELYDEMEKNIKWTLSPKLKFEKVEGSIGEYTTEIKYTQLVPVITAAGALESLFSWDMKQTQGHPLCGARWFHAVVKRPKGADGVQARFNVVADVVTEGRLFRFGTKEEAKMQASRLICD